MRYQFEFRPYHRRFQPPLQTSHGNWDIRDGIILCLSDETGTSNGEIAPISWFGSETMEQALDFCRQLPTEITDKTIFSVPDDLPACQFGFESAWEGVLGCWEAGGAGEEFYPSPLTFSGLLPAGEGALEAWQTLWEQGYSTFKWKIGVYPIPDEIEIFQALTRNLPASAKLRLDANGGLSYQDANYWLWTCDRLPGEVEFIEQPLPVEQFEEMQELRSKYSTAIALDESVATLKQLEACYQQGWRSIFVIKPCIAGSPSRLRQFCREHQIDIVFSSVFETAVGREAALKLATELSCHRAVGFGINHWFDEDET
jgi:O-succinylbenzoate synthase